MPRVFINTDRYMEEISSICDEIISDIEGNLEYAKNDEIIITKPLFNGGGDMITRIYLDETTDNVQYDAGEDATGLILCEEPVNVLLNVADAINEMDLD